MANFIGGDANTMLAIIPLMIRSRSEAFSLRSSLPSFVAVVRRLVKTCNALKRTDAKFYYLYLKFIIAGPRGGPIGSGTVLPPSHLPGPFLQRFLASSHRRPNLSFLNFLLISSLLRNRDRRIKRMSRRSPKCIGTQTECRPSFFAPPPSRRALPRLFNPGPAESRDSTFLRLLLHLRSVSFTWPRCYRPAEERHFSANNLRARYPSFYKKAISPLEYLRCRG